MVVRDEGSGARRTGGPRRDSSGLLVGVLVAAAAAVGLAIYKTSDGGGSALADSLSGAALICVPLCIVALTAVHLLRGTARRVASFTGKRAFLVLGNTNTGVDQLRSVDGYATPFFPVVCVTENSFDIWRRAEDGQPIVSIPLSAVTVEVGTQWAVIPQAALVLDVAGITNPIYFSLYGDRWWSFIPMRATALEETARAVGLIRGEGGQDQSR
jgi:hypothetical protein